MFEIPQKFTGFNVKASDFRDFKILCYSLQGLGLFKVIEVTDYDYPKNYYGAEVRDSSGTYHLLMNCFVPYVCLKKGEGRSAQFFEKTNVSSAIHSVNPDIITLSSEQLKQRITDMHLVNLSRIERNEINRWRPTTVAEVMFSWFFD